MQPNEFRVAIIGGGIGGLSCALSLSHHCPGIKLDIYEQAPQYREIGAGIGIGVNAAKILHKIGVGKEANAISGERHQIHRSMRRWDNGDEIVRIDAGFETGDVKQLSVHRAEFLQVLYDGVVSRNIATLHTNKRCNKVLENGDIVEVYFEDGTKTSANLTVACDGIHSLLRAQFEVDNPRYSGIVAYRGLLPLDVVAEFWPYDSYALTWLGQNKHFLVSPVSANKTMNVLACVTTPIEKVGGLKESWSAVAPRTELEKEFADWDPVIRKIIANMPSEVGKWLLNDRYPLSNWVHLGGKLVIMGDAAHAMLPHQGSGAGHAIEDGYILGRTMQDFFKHSAKDPSTPLETWTKLYQNVRLPRAQKGQITSRQAGEVYEMQDKDFEGLTYDECLPIIEKKLKTRMHWVWGGNIDQEYDAIVEKLTS